MKQCRLITCRASNPRMHLTCAFIIPADCRCVRRLLSPSSSSWRWLIPTFWGEKWKDYQWEHWSGRRPAASTLTDSGSTLPLLIGLIKGVTVTHTHTNWSPCSGEDVCQTMWPPVFFFSNFWNTFFLMLLFWLIKPVPNVGTSWKTIKALLAAAVASVGHWVCHNLPENVQSKFVTAGVLNSRGGGHLQPMNSFLQPLTRCQKIMEFCPSCGVFSIHFFFSHFRLRLSFRL